jgi:transcriptional regulator with XRE-family HTH domain
MARKNDYTEKLNKYIGEKLQYIRLSQGLSRLQLGSLIDVSGQQIQKYELGVNAISVARLTLISKALNHDVASFYAGYDENIISQNNFNHQRVHMEVSRNLLKIDCRKQKTAINSLIKSLCSEARI